MADEPLDTDRRREIQTTRLLKRAIKRGWDIPPDKLQGIMERQTELAVSLPPGREQQAAVESVLAMNQQDLELVKMVVKREADADAGHSGPVQVVINTRPMKGDNDAGSSNASNAGGSGGTDSRADAE